MSKHLLARNNRLYSPFTHFRENVSTIAFSFFSFFFLVKRIIKYFGRRRVKRIIERLGYRMERREIDGKSIQDKRHLRERLSSIVGHR